MSPETVMDLAYRGMQVALMLAAPMLITALALGLLVSLFQAATQINEMTLSFIPKILGVFLVLMIAGPFLLQVITEFTRNLFQNIPMMLG